MDFDDIVIGSGLSALGALLGIVASSERRVLVLSGPQTAAFSYYDSTHASPCAYQGNGGLGNFWHGVIPLGWSEAFAGATRADFIALFNSFYPATHIADRLGSPLLFVPWRAIRPAGFIERLAQSAPQRITVLPDIATAVQLQDSHASVTSSSRTITASRVWVAAGALHTPTLLARTFGEALKRNNADDHVLCYIGQTHGNEVPVVRYTGNGLLFPATYSNNKQALYTKRPATFAYRKLDFGIEQRAIFGMPTGNIVKKLARRMSPGLLVEAFYNRFGLFAGARTQSVYAQVAVPDAYKLLDDPAYPLQLCPDNVYQATEAARAAQPFANLTPSRLTRIALPGIHLHHTLDLQAVASAGLNVPGSPVQIVDASALHNIGAEHHSFKMMLSAWQRARACA